MCRIALITKNPSPSSARFRSAIRTLNLTVLISTRASATLAATATSNPFSNLSVDGSFVEANANKDSRIPREQLAEAAQVKQPVRQYLVQLEQPNQTEEPQHEQQQVSTTDP